jgi:hypothetical protein
MLEKLKKNILEESQPDDTLSENDSNDARSIRLYYDNAQANGKATNHQNGQENEYIVTKNSYECHIPGDSSVEEEEEAIYPWYRNAPIQHLIGDNYLKSKGMKFSSRPQKDEEENGIIRTFPRRSKIIKPNNILSPRNDAQPLNNKTTNIVKEAGTGFILKRNGNMSWVSKTLMSNAEAATLISTQNSFIGNKNLPFINSQRPDSNECFEFLKTKVCQAGALCKYKHDGHDEHQKIKLCQKYMNGLCRDGDSCSKGSHALLRHQIPVCGYYLRATCPLLKGVIFCMLKIQQTPHYAFILTRANVLPIFRFV